MRRRDFMLAAAASGLGVGALFAGQQRISASVAYPGRDQGHWLRDAKSLPQPTATIETDVLIAGSGVGGLTAAWQLAKLGVRDLMIVGGPELHGNAAAGHDGGLAFPTGAHYLPLPSMESVHIREMLHDFGIIQRDPYGERPTYDERCLVHSPAERVLYRGAWQEGYLPAEEVSSDERAEHARFFAMVDWYSNARGEDGRRAFAVPLEFSSDDEKFRALDRLTFKTWLDGVELKSPTLHWYLDYCCRDDYGRHYDEVSAWAGLHYFCGRDGAAANAERGAVLTWPEGLAALAVNLQRSAGAPQDWLKGSVAQLQATSAGVEALVISLEGSIKAVRVKARQAVAAMPLVVLQHVFAGARCARLRALAGVEFRHACLSRGAVRRAACLGQRALPGTRFGLRGIDASGDSRQPARAHRFYRLPRTLRPRAGCRPTLADGRKHGGSAARGGPRLEAGLRVALAAVRGPCCHGGTGSRHGDPGAGVPLQSGAGVPAQCRGSDFLRALRPVRLVAVRRSRLVGLSCGAAPGGR
jgi:hypothetical protein